MTSVKELFEEGHNKVQESNAWCDAVQHVLKEEEKYWSLDGLGNQPAVEPFIINIGNDTPSSSQVSLSSSSAPPFSQHSHSSSCAMAPCWICGSDQDIEAVEWFGCDDCPKWYHMSCLDLFEQVQAKNSLVTQTS